MATVQDHYYDFVKSGSTFSTSVVSRGELSHTTIAMSNVDLGV